MGNLLRYRAYFSEANTKQQLAKVLLSSWFRVLCNQSVIALKVQQLFLQDG
jgi:hypothetical protein